MKNNTGNYGEHAQYWDWGKLDYDRTPHDKYWFDYAKKYGNSALIPMLHGAKQAHIWQNAE